MKKMIAAVLALLTLAVCTSALAGNKPGDTVTVSFSVTKNAENAVAISFDMSYDRSVLQFVSAAVAGENAVVPEDENSGFGRFSMSGAVPTGPVGTVTFKIKENAPGGKYPVTATNIVKMNANGDSVGGVTISGGTVEVEASPAPVTPTPAGGNTPPTVVPTVDDVTPQPETPAVHTHKAGKWTVTKEATCTEAGEREQRCAECGEVLKTEKVKALGHDKGKWTVVKEATQTEKGQEELHCTRCGELIKTRQTSSVSYMNNNLRSVGEKLADLKPGITEKWYTITPVDLSKDGEQHFEMLTGGYYTIGTVTVTVNGDAVKVEYRFNKKVTESAEHQFYTFFADADSITGAEADEIENRFQYGQEYSIQKDLGGDTDVLLYMLNKGMHAK